MKTSSYRDELYGIYVGLSELLEELEKGEISLAQNEFAGRMESINEYRMIISPRGILTEENPHLWDVNHNYHKYLEYLRKGSKKRLPGKREEYIADLKEILGITRPKRDSLVSRMRQWFIKH